MIISLGKSVVEIDDEALSAGTFVVLRVITPDIEKEQPETPAQRRERYNAIIRKLNTLGGMEYTELHPDYKLVTEEDIQFMQGVWERDRNG